MVKRKKITKAARLKTAREQRMNTPCPSCDKWDFMSTSGRTLHIKACKEKVKNPKKEKAEVNEKMPEIMCPYCNKFFKNKTATQHNEHLNDCFTFKVNKEGHMYDPRLKMWITKAPRGCTAQHGLKMVLECGGRLRLGINPLEQNDLRDLGCWQEGVGECTYASSSMTDKKTRTYGVETGSKELKAKIAKMVKKASKKTFKKTTKKTTKKVAVKKTTKKVSI